MKWLKENQFYKENYPAYEEGLSKYFASQGFKSSKNNLIPIEYDGNPIEFLVKFISIISQDKNVILIAKGQKHLLPKLDHINDSPEEKMICFLTSGSSGKPKIIVHSLKTLEESIKSFIEYFKISSENNSYISLPLNHVGGLMQSLRALYINADLNFFQGELPLEIKDHSIFSCVEAQLDSWDRSKLINAKLVLLGGQAPNLKKLKEYSKKLNNLYVSYGASESAAMVACATADDIQGELLFGTIMPNRKVYLDNENKIILSGAGICLGYIENNSFHKLDQVKTNDFGIIENEKLAVTGRSDLIFISGGENIDPIFIENSIKKELGGECILLPFDDQVFGKTGHAFLHPFPLDKTYNEIKSILKKDLASYQIPKSFLPLPQIFLNNGKVSRSKLKEYYSNIDVKILTIHGFFGDAQDWQDVFKHSPFREKCIHYNISGIADKTFLDKETIFKEIQEIMKENKVTHLLGYSLGGRILIEGILEKKINNLPLCLIASNPGISEEEIPSRKKWEEEVTLKISHTSSEEFFKYWYGLNIFTGLQEHKNFQKLLQRRKENFHTGLVTSFNEFSITKTKNYWNSMNVLNGLYVYGENDKKYEEIALKLEPQSQLKIKKIPEGSHFAHWQNPQEFNFIFNQFILS
tara:strand:- start:15007 stop:16920 length:1914 start_codon:yes stop_codon:yes gene_type:complete